VSIATVVTRGYGSFGSIALVVTRGYSIGAALAEPLGLSVVATVTVRAVHPGTATGRATVLGKADATGGDP